MIVQLIYTSRLIFNASTPEGWRRIEDIVTRARERNRLAQITGFLVVGQDWAAQILEGGQDEVNRVFQRILADHRHQDVKLVDIRIARKRQFEGWSLGASQHPREDLPFEAHAPISGRFSPLGFEDILALAKNEAA